MKRVFLALVFILVSLLIIQYGCKEDTNPEKETLYVFNWTDYIGENTIESFEKKFNINVVYDNYSSNEELMAKLKTGGASYDVIFPSGYAAAILKSRNQLKKIPKEDIPNLKYIPTEFRKPYFDKNMNISVPYTWSTTGIGYNTKFIKENSIDSWSILFDDKYKNQILMLDDPRATIGMALKYLGFSVNTTEADNLNKAASVLFNQKPLVHVYTNDNLPQLFSSEEVKLGYGWSGDIRQAMKQNSNIKYSIPKEGTIIYIDYICIPESSKNPNLAAKFINFILEPENSLDIVRTTSYATTNSGAQKLADEELKELWKPMEKDSKDSIHFESIKNLGDKTALYDEVWQELKEK